VLCFYKIVKDTIFLLFYSSVNTDCMFAYCIMSS